GCFIAEDEQSVGGYIVGAVDTRAFEARLEAEWWPKLRAAYPDPAGPFAEWSADERMAYLIHHPFSVPDHIVERHPSHLHINLLPHLQGKGLGRRLMDRWLACMAQAGSPGAHLGVGAPNMRGRAFYEAYGFTLLEETRHTLWYGIAL
ncbi:GNAT family N-acetyltransferase, partial [Parvibaculum sp.]|uniref:GNAT family N-acetyltransferase n=1 Tax=Parvibaculum sp. TaxID=2024848 RepID=UPI003C729A1B